jgi:uncharacterized protein (UPF0332 family)/predicted nucleotidyltransferase
MATDSTDLHPVTGENIDLRVSASIRALKEHLLKTEVANRVVKIILFGSQAKGSATQNSDLDVMVLTADGDRTERALMDHIHDFMVESGTPLEVVTAGIADLISPRDYFVYHVLQHGIEVYSMEKKQLKKAMVDSILGLCDEYLDSAREVMHHNRVRLAVDAAYNAAELATKALILLKQDDLPGSHGGVVAVFGQLYVKAGIVDRELGRDLNVTLKLRNEARYRPDATLTAENAATVLDLAERLITLAKNHAKELQA